MDWYTTIKRHYDAGRYSVEQLKVFTDADKITVAEFESITGQPYEGSE